MTLPSRREERRCASGAAELIAEAAGRLGRAGLSRPRRDAGLLLASVLGVPAWRLVAEPGTPVGEAQRDRFLAMAARRERHEPVAYLLGNREFWGRPFEVGPAVLVPRPETEGLVEAALAATERPDPRIAEVGTGSGCVAVSLALELPGARVVATEPDPGALETARRNARRHGVAERVEFREGADLEPLADLAGRLDLLVSNPPYVAETDWAGLERQVRDWEPRGALVAGPTGLEVLERLCAGAGELLAPRGRLLFEIGAGQAPAVRGFLEGWQVETRPDLAGIERVVVATRTGGSEGEHRG